MRESAITSNRKRTTPPVDATTQAPPVNLVPMDPTDITCGVNAPDTDIQNLPLITRVLDRNAHNIWITNLWKCLMTNSLGGAPKKRQKVHDKLGEVGIDVSIGGTAY